MFLSTIEFVCGLLIGLVVGHLLHYKTYIQLCNINQKLEIIIQAVETKKIKVKSKSSKPLSEPHYSFDIETLWKDFKTLFDKKAELDSDFLFNQVATQIRELRVTRSKVIIDVEEVFIIIVFFHAVVSF